MTEYEKNKALEELGKKTIKEHEDLAECTQVRIGYQYSSQAKKSNKKLTFADCTKVSDKLKQFINYDFIITFYLPNVEDMSQEAKEILMYHELLHVGYEDGKMFTRPHDVEDFERIIKEHGFSWEVM